MLYRHLTVPLHRAAQAGGALLVQGPRGSGKTTLLRQELPAHVYACLEESRTRLAARTDPAAFLARLRGPALIDDAHLAPELIAHLSAHSDLADIVLASSRRLTVPFPVLELHAPTRAELARRPPVSLEMLGRFVPATAAPAPTPPTWPTTRSFLHHDVLALVQLRDLDRFERFLDAARHTSGQVLDQQHLARACALSHRTVSRWLAVLDQVFLTLRLPPADLDFGRRLVRSPKLHFLDSPHLESEIVSELYRNARHAGAEPDLRYWRDSNGFEIPLIVQSEAGPPMPVGIASTPGEAHRVARWMDLAALRHGAIISPAQLPTRAPGLLRYAPQQL